MEKRIFGLIVAIALMTAGHSPAIAGETGCGDKDTACKYFSQLATQEKFDKIVAAVEPARTYSVEAKAYIGQAYLMLAGQEGNTPEQEERFCLKAVEYGAMSGYMGLYFIHASADQGRALGYLKKYIATKPQDAVPYVILGEAELEARNYVTANTYLLEAKRLSRGRSSNLEWLMFQTRYLLGDYAGASTMLDNAITYGQPVNDLKNLVTDPRFAGLEKRPEFRKYETMLKGISAKAIY